MQQTQQLSEIRQKIIPLAIQYGIIGFSFLRPITFRSGIRSPIYCDWRKAQDFPDLMELITQAFLLMIGTDFDKNNTVIAGVPTGGSPHAEGVRRELHASGCYVRPGANAKGYGLGKRIEGASVKGKKVKMFEDLVSTAGSVIENAEVRRSEGAIEVECYCIFTYGFKRSERELEDHTLSLNAVLTAADILPFVKEKLTEGEYALLNHWLLAPEEWFEHNKRILEFGYLTMLRKTAFEIQNIICLGGDPNIAALPEPFDLTPAGIVEFYREYFEMLAINGLQPATFKPNQGYYECFNRPVDEDFSGSAALAKTIKLCRFIFPDTTIILDAKRGDIGPSSGNYAQDLFSWNVDALTISGYMGTDSIEPFSKYCNPEVKKGVYILARTSNKGAADIQGLQTLSGEPVFSCVGDKIVQWATKKPGVGAVVGATSIPELKILAKKFTGKDIPLLIPGVGKQGGRGDEVIAALIDVGMELDIVRINSSSGLTHPWYSKENPQRGPRNWKDQCLEAFESLLKETAY